VAIAERPIWYRCSQKLDSSAQHNPRTGPCALSDGNFDFDISTRLSSIGTKNFKKSQGPSSHRPT